MNYLEKILYSIEKDFLDDPNRIWEQLEEDDLLVTSTRGSKYIVSVDNYDSRNRIINIKFIYSIATNKFYGETGKESPSMVERGPTTEELTKLKSNPDYLIFISK